VLVILPALAQRRLCENLLSARDEWAQEYGSYSQEQILERHEFEDGSPKWFKHACEDPFAGPTSAGNTSGARSAQVVRKLALGARYDRDGPRPALKRVTITPSAHGHLFTPLYPTPIIRAFPKGFN
jgi:hypothetical protein